MPIGWEGNLGGESSRSQPDDRNTSARQDIFEEVADIAISIVDDIITVIHRILEPEIWTRWQTASDEKVCPICGPYAGRAWKENDGPQPPLHPNCRCQRVYAFTTWITTE